MDKNKDTAINTRYPEDVLRDMRTLAQKHERSFNGEVVWALRHYIALHWEEVRFSVVQQRYIREALTKNGFADVERLPPDFTKEQLYRWWGLKEPNLETNPYPSDAERAMQSVIYAALGVKEEGQKE